MSEEKSLGQQKREAAQKAKEEALKRLAEKKTQAESAEENGAEEARAKSKEELKKEAAEKAKAAAQKRLAEKQAAENQTNETSDDPDDAKQKAIAAAKAKAAAAAKAKAAALAKSSGEAPASENMDDEAKAKAKAKAIAAAKAKAAAAAKAKSAVLSKEDDGAGQDEKAKAIAAAKAKAAAAAAAKAKSSKSGAEEITEEQKPSLNQPFLDKYVKVIEQHLGDVLEESYINRLSKDVPTLVVKKETYYKVAEFLKYNEQLAFDYLSELHGTDFVTHMEMYSHFYSYKNKQSVALRVKIDRDEPVIDSLAVLWEGANWPEREAYDLLGIKFTNHPNLTRIMLPDDWVGHPLRKDYEPYDVEV